jgi:HSP20 family protein
MNMSDTNVTKSVDSVKRSGLYTIPAVDVVEDATGVTLYADLPGVPKEQLNLQVEADVLTIEGVANVTEPVNLKALHTEVKPLRYRREFTLSKELDADKISAEFQQGVLKLFVPKAAQAQPRKINVNVH